jgi:aminoglycoside phosphotransferase (APT) family kinase protein
MTRMRLLGSGRISEVFLDGDDVVKLQASGVGPEEAEREKRVLELLTHTPLNVPRAKGIVEIEGRWGLRMTRMPGQPMADLALESGDGAAFVATLAQVHASVLNCSGAGLPSLRERLRQRIKVAPKLAETLRKRLLAGLDEMPDGDRLCHGDFHPFNIIQDGETYSIIDWPDAASGAPAADVARTYMIILLYRSELAELYLDAMDAEGFGRAETLRWLPYAAAARLVEGIEGEVSALHKMCGRGGSGPGWSFGSLDVVRDGL